MMVVDMRNIMHEFIKISFASCVIRDKFSYVSHSHFVSKYRPSCFPGVFNINNIAYFEERSFTVYLDSCLFALFSASRETQHLSASARNHQSSKEEGIVQIMHMFPFREERTSHLER